MRGEERKTESATNNNEIRDPFSIRDWVNLFSHENDISLD